MSEYAASIVAGSKRIASEAGHRKFRCVVQVANSAGEVVLLRPVAVELGTKPLSTAEVQARVDRAKAKALLDAANTDALDLEAIS